MASKKLSPEEMASVERLPFGRKHSIRIMIERMQPGDMLRIEREDFQWKKKTPGLFCAQISKRTKAKFDINKERGKTSWLVERRS